MNTDITTPTILEVDAINGLALQTKTTIQEAFLPFAIQFQEWSEKVEGLVVTDELEVDKMKLAREARLALVKIRTGADKIRKELKEESLRYGKAVQEVYNKIEDKISSMESHLEKQEKFKELLDQKRMAERIAARMDRLKDFPEVSSSMIAGFNDEMFETFLSGLEAKRQNDIAEAKRIEEERIAAIEAEKKRQAEIQAENERLRKEAELKEKQLAAERAKVEAERKAAEEKLAKEREEAEAKIKAEREAAEKEAKRIQAIRDAEIAKEREAKAKLEAEIQAKKEAERKESERVALEEKQRIAAEKKAAKAPDKAKLLKWVGELECALPEMKTDEGKELASEIQMKYEGFKKWAKSQIETI